MVNCDSDAAAESRFRLAFVYHVALCCKFVGLTEIGIRREIHILRFGQADGCSNSGIGAVMRSLCGRLFVNQQQHINLCWTIVVVGNDKKEKCFQSGG